MPFNPSKVKPGRDYFNGNFFTLLAVVVYLLFFYKKLTGEDVSGKLQENLVLNHFTTWQTLTLFALMCIMLIERMLYRSRKTSWFSNETGVVMNPEFSNEDEFSKHTLAVKLILYLIEVLVIHIVIAFKLPIQQGTTLWSHGSLLVFYFLWVAHWVYAALQIKHGYPQAPYK